MSAVPLYDAFAADYDRFVNWPERLAFELPFFRTLLARRGARRVLDVAGGTGQHAIALAAEGFEVTLADLSAEMVAHARANAAEAGVSLRAVQAGFGGLAGAVGTSPEARLDAVLCLGNSLPHALTPCALGRAGGDMAAVLASSGVIVIQNRNFDRVLARGERFMPPQEHRAGDEEWLFIRFYDAEEDLLRFNVVRLHRARGEAWAARVDETLLHPWRRDDLVASLERAGLKRIETLGSYRGEPFDPQESGDLILVAEAP